MGHFEALAAVEFRASGSVIWAQRRDGTESVYSEHDTPQEAKEVADGLNEAIEPGKEPFSL